MSIYDKSSLVLIPSGTKTGKVFSQKPVSGDGDFTFTRASAATRVNADGNIEKETGNLLLYSNTFSNSNWVKTGTTITSGQSGYDGSNDASLLLSTTTGFPRVEQTISTSGVLTYSVYLKEQNDSFALLRTYGATAQVWFDLTDGSVANEAGDDLIDASIEDIGNDWYRASVTISGSFIKLRIYPASAYGVYSTASNGIYIQDAQLEQGLVARDYIETTTAAVYGGITDNTPRLDYTDSSCPALLLEPQRRNLLIQSEYLGATWVAAGGLTITQNNAISPEGVQNASTLDFNLVQGYMYYYYAGIDYTGKKLTFSYYIKGTAGATAIARSYSSASIKTTLTTLNGDWQRVEHTFDGGTFNYVYPIDSRNGGTATSVQVYGMQLEDDGTGGGTSYATSYIPTYGSSVSRVAETCTDAGTSATFNSTEGVLYFEGSAISGNDSTFKRIAIGTSDDNFVNNINIRYNTDGVSVTYQYRVGSVYQADLTIPINQTDVNKIACVWKVNRFEIWLNGVKAAEDTSGSVISANTLDTMYYGKTTTFSEPLYGKTNQVLVFPTALSDEELAALTTI